MKKPKESKKEIKEMALETVEENQEAEKEKTDESPISIKVETQEAPEEETPPEKASKEETLKEETSSEETSEDEKETPQEETEEEKETEEELLDDNEVKGSSWWQTNKKFVFIGLMLVVFAAIVTGGILVYQKAMKKKEAKEVIPLPVAVSSPVPESSTPTPTSTPTPELKREDLKLQVLNGSGIAGRAGEVKDFLEGLGYVDVEVGNAGSYDYEEAEVSIKEEKTDYLELLTEDLEDEYALSTESATLNEDSDFDAVVTIGKG